VNEKRRPPFDDLRDAIDLDHALLELASLVVVQHPSELQTSLARAVGERFHTTVVEIASAVEDTPLDSCLLRARREKLPDLGRLFDYRP